MADSKKYYGAFKETWNSSNACPYENIHNDKIAAILFDGLGARFHLGGCYEDKEDAKMAVAHIREQARIARQNQRYGYVSYRDKIFVHEVDENGNYIPTTGEIKKAVEYMAYIVEKYGDENYGGHSYGHFLFIYKDVSPAKIRQELIENGKLIHIDEC